MIMQNTAGVGNDLEGDMPNIADDGLDIGFRQKGDVLGFILHHPIGDITDHQKLEK